MKRSIKIALIFFALAALSFLGLGVLQMIQHKKQVEHALRILPDFSFSTLNAQTFGSADLQPGTPKIFVYFNTTCEYCQDEAKQFAQQLEKFKNTQLLFISTEEPKTIKTFAQHYKLTVHDNIRFLHDAQNRFAALFGANSIPYILIYNANNQLVYKHKGAVKVENLLMELEQ